LESPSRWATHRVSSSGSASAKQPAKNERGRDTVELQRRFGTLIPHKPGVNEAAHADDSNRIGFGR